MTESHLEQARAQLKAGDVQTAAMHAQLSIAESLEQLVHLHRLASDDRATAQAAIDERDQLRAVLERVRELHSPRLDQTDEYVCTGCGDYYGDCRTIAALDGEGQ